MKEHLGSALPGEAWQAEQTRSLRCSIPTAPRGAGNHTSFVNKAAASKEPCSPCAPIPGRHWGQHTSATRDGAHGGIRAFGRDACSPSAQAGGTARGAPQVPGKGTQLRNGWRCVCSPGESSNPPRWVPNHAVMAAGGARRMRTRDKKKLAAATRLPRGPPATASAQERESAEGIRAASALRLQSCEGNIMMCETPSCQLPAAGPTLPLE